MRAAKNSTEVLKAGLWILENVGWVKGVSSKMQDGKYVGFCASGALGMVETTDDAQRLRARYRLSEAMGDSIICFNDHHRTTKKMVINAFKRAIKKGSK